MTDRILKNWDYTKKTTLIRFGPKFADSSSMRLERYMINSARWLKVCHTVGKFCPIFITIVNKAGGQNKSRVEGNDEKPLLNVKKKLFW